jgi:hypothetical protein
VPIAPPAIEQQDSWDFAVSGAHLSMALPKAKCAICSRASLHSGDGSTRLFISNGGSLTFERVADETVLWSSGVQPPPVGAVDAAAVAAIGLFLQVSECVRLASMQFGSSAACCAADKDPLSRFCQKIS